MAETPDLLDDGAAPADARRGRGPGAGARRADGPRRPLAPGAVQWRRDPRGAAAAGRRPLHRGRATRSAAPSVARMSDRAEDIAGFLERAGPRRPPRSTMFVGRDSGTFAYVVDPADDSVVQGPDFEASVRGPPGRGRGPRRGATRAGTSGTPPSTRPEPRARAGVPGAHPEPGASPRTPVSVVVQVVQDRTAEVETLDSLLRVLLGGGLLALVAGEHPGRGLRDPRAGAHPRVARAPSATRSDASASSRRTRATSCARR